MSYNSPFLNPQQYITKVNDLSSEAITVDEGVDRSIREARDFSNKHSSNFALVAAVKDALEQFEPRWTKALQDSRDASSSLIGWLRRFDQVFLAMINDVGSEQDAKDVVAEFQDFLGGGHPSGQYQLDGTPGPKKAFEEIEGLVDIESTHVVDVMQDSKNWQKAVEELKKKLPDVRNGVNQVRTALEKYAVKLE